MNRNLLDIVIDGLDAYRSANDFSLSDLKQLKHELESLAWEFDEEITRKDLIVRTGTAEVEKW